MKFPKDSNYLKYILKILKLDCQWFQKSIKKKKKKKKYIYILLFLLIRPYDYPICLVHMHYQLTDQYRLL